MVLFLSFLPGVDLFEPVLFLVEHFPYVLAFNIILLGIVKRQFRGFIFCLIPTFIILGVGVTVITSYEYALRDGYNLSNPSLREALELYIESGEGSLEDILTGNKYPPVFGKYEVGYLVKDLLRHTFIHSDEHNQDLVPVTYNKGNDWYRATIGEPMQYSGGLFNEMHKDLNRAQTYKLDYIAHSLGLKEGDLVLDLGCGWSSALAHFTNKYKVTVIGVTLSSEQVAYFNENVKPKLRKGAESKVILEDAMNFLNNPEIAGKKFDKIYSIEMMEHIGIRRYQTFLATVKEALKDEGVFYVQVAGLRRGWMFEDFVWGLFMGQHIFPGADASVPIGWVATQLERSGFEVQQIHNTGTHYSRVIALWLEEWRSHKDQMVQLHGIKEYRRWEVFLRWSVKIAHEGASTLFMITTTKFGDGDVRLGVQQRLVPKW